MSYRLNEVSRIEAGFPQDFYAKDMGARLRLRRHARTDRRVKIVVQAFSLLSLQPGKAAP
jgi:hypothetical protein